jgi:hypothetical protein
MRELITAVWGAAAAPLKGEFHDKNIDHRDGFRRSPVFYVGVHTGAKPYWGTDP